MLEPWSRKGPRPHTHPGRHPSTCSNCAHDVHMQHLSPYLTARHAVCEDKQHVTLRQGVPASIVILLAPRRLPCRQQHQQGGHWHSGRVNMGMGMGMAPSEPERLGQPKAHCQHTCREASEQQRHTPDSEKEAAAAREWQRRFCLALEVCWGGPNAALPLSEMGWGCWCSVCCRFRDSLPDSEVSAGEVGSMIANAGICIFCQTRDK